MLSFRNASRPSRALLSFCVLIAAALFSPVNAKPKAVRLEPVTDWYMEWDEDSCVLSRGFGDSKDMSVLRFERFSPGDQFQLLITSSSLRNLRQQDRPVIQFGSADAPVKLNRALVGKSEDGRATLFISGISLHGEIDEKIALTSLSPITPEQEASIDKISVHARRKLVVFETASLGKPFEAMRDCTKDLIKLWGLDWDQQSSLLRRLRPLTSPTAWLHGNDYPKDELMRGGQAIVNFRLTVDAQGIPTACSIQRSYSRENGKFDKYTCNLLLQRARFEPAIDEGGRPVPSFYSNTVTWIVGP